VGTKPSTKVPGKKAIIGWLIFGPLLGAFYAIFWVVAVWGWNEIRLERKLLAEGVETTAIVIWFNPASQHRKHTDPPEIGYQYKVGNTTYEGNCDVTRSLQSSTAIRSHIKILYLKDKPDFSGPKDIKPDYLKPLQFIGLCLATIFIGYFPYTLVKTYRESKAEESRNVEHGRGNRTRF